ncbi:MAG: hypothetical protein ACLSAH_13015 [Bilophila wadsworthia]
MSSSNVFTGRSAETMMDRREVSFMLASEATFLRGFVRGLPSRAATVLKVWVRVTSAAFCSRRRGLLTEAPCSTLMALPIAVVDQLADPGEADIPCAAEHRAAHGPEVDGFGVFSRAGAAKRA